MQGTCEISYTPHFVEIIRQKFEIALNFKEEYNKVSIYVGGHDMWETIHVTYASPEGVPEYTWMKRILLFIFFTSAAWIVLCFFAYVSPLFKPYSSGGSFFNDFYLVPRTSRITLFLVLLVTALYLGCYFLRSDFNVRKVIISSKGVYFKNIPYRYHKIIPLKEIVYVAWDEMVVEELDGKLFVREKSGIGESIGIIQILPARHYKNEFELFKDDLKSRNIIS